jgi:hypothetical protein
MNSDSSSGSYSETETGSNSSFEEWKIIFLNIHKEYQEWMSLSSRYDYSCSCSYSRSLYPECILNSETRSSILNAPKLNHKPPYASRLATILFKENFKPEHQKYVGLPYLPYHMTTLERVTYNDSRERACVQYRKFIRTLQGLAISYQKIMDIS